MTVQQKIENAIAILEAALEEERAKDWFYGIRDALEALKDDD